MQEENIKEQEDQVEGRNSVLEILKADKSINKLIIQKGNNEGSIREIIALAREKHVVISEVDKFKFNQIAKTNNPQGVIALVPPFEYVDVQDILDYAKEKGEKPFIVILDEIEDPGNLGAILRTCDCVGVHGVIISKRRGAKVNSTVSKISSGATQYVKVAMVTNITESIRFLKDNNVWIYGTDVAAERYYDEETYDSGTAIVIGNEANGMSRLVKENCDFLVKIPMKGHIQSLNASVSLGIVAYEVLKQRDKM